MIKFTAAQLGATQSERSQLLIKQLTAMNDDELPITITRGEQSFIVFPDGRYYQLSPSQLRDETDDLMKS